MLASIRSHRKLLFYDAVLLIAVICLFFSFDSGNVNVNFESLIIHGVIIFVGVFIFRLIFSVYAQIWRFGGAQSYIRLIGSDLCAGVLISIVCRLIPVVHVTPFKIVSIVAVACLSTVLIRLLYQFMYKTEIRSKTLATLCNWILKVFANGRIQVHTPESVKKTKIAIVGAGKLGVSLANELLENPESGYEPVMFIDRDSTKQGKKIEGLVVNPPNDNTLRIIKLLEIKEVIFAITNISDEHRARLFDFYRKTGCKLKIFDNSILYASDKNQIRSIDVEDLLSRNSVNLNINKLGSYFEGKTVFITGGGGSIGSEMSRQIAYMNPKNLVLIDIAENGMYDVFQDIKIALNKSDNIDLEVTSITDKNSMDKLFLKYQPQVVIHAAAHKHVPLMEHNCIEAIKNNIIGTKIVIDLSEKYNVQKFMMVSTDKAVNPTSVMGATKRFCEMMVQVAAKNNGNTSYASTRFGNVLGSAGSVVPLFRRQIAHGGPITITDKRIVRYFMTIPEACSLVLHATVLSNNGEIFVLDMGEPVKIIDLANNMIKLSGAKNIQIIETGLRKGEKLFEEILIDPQHFNKTENELIFVEKENDVEVDFINKHLDKLIKISSSDDELLAYNTLVNAVPTFVESEFINKNIN